MSSAASSLATFRKDDEVGYLVAVRDDTLWLAAVDPSNDDWSKCISFGKGHLTVEPSFPRDLNHEWFKYNTEGNGGDGKPSFVLINKAKLLALSHEMLLVPFNPDEYDESVIWTTERGLLYQVKKGTRLDLDAYKDFRAAVDDMHSGATFRFHGFNGDKPSRDTDEYAYGFNAKYPPYGFNSKYPYGFNGDKPSADTDEYAYGFNAKYPPYGFNGDKPSGDTDEYPYGFNGDKHVNSFVSDGHGPAKHADGEPPYWQRLRKRLQQSGILNGGKEESAKPYWENVRKRIQQLR